MDLVKARHAALIRKGIIEARRDAIMVAACDPSIAALGAEFVQLRPENNPPAPLTVEAYLREFPKALASAAWAPAMNRLMADIREAS